MKIDNLTTNQLSPEAYAWYLEYLAALDAKDIDAYATYLASGVTIQFNNGPPVEGKDAVIGMLSGYWQSFKSLEHDLTNIYGTDRKFVLEARNHYERHDGKQVAVNAVALPTEMLTATSPQFASTATRHLSLTIDRGDESQNVLNVGSMLVGLLTQVTPPAIGQVPTRRKSQLQRGLVKPSGRDPFSLLVGTSDTPTRCCSIESLVGSLLLRSYVVGEETLKSGA